MIKNLNKPDKELWFINDFITYGEREENNFVIKKGQAVLSNSSIEFNGIEIQIDELERILSLMKKSN